MAGPSYTEYRSPGQSRLGRISSGGWLPTLDDPDAVRAKGCVMSSLEANKIAAAILVGGMITLSTGILAGFSCEPHRAAEASKEGGEGGAAPAAPAQKAIEPVLGLIAKADAGKGENIAKKCQTCHSFDQAGTNK